EAAQKIASYLFKLASDTDGFTVGRYGPDDDQTTPNAKSTEENFALWAAFRRLSMVMGGRGSTAWAVTYAAAAEKARLFVQKMYSPDCGCFYYGAGEDGVTPDTDVVVFDSSAMAVLVMGDDLPEPERVMAYIRDNFAVDHGFDFNQDRDGIWFEGTVKGQLCEVARGNAGAAAETLEYLNQQRRPDWSLPAADHDGLTTGLAVEVDGTPRTFDNRAYLGATAWLGLAKMGVNPIAKPS
ncbi:MAG: hypothetical protein LBH76_04120, partial [Propionibacteriaceae bacterium]|nr:hypothetical protein [Propionibacteriaceae bacterium]